MPKPPRTLDEFVERGVAAQRAVDRFVPSMPHPSVKQLVDVANRVQQVRTDPSFVHPFTVEQLCIIGWALGIATTAVMDPPSNWQMMLEKLTARVSDLEKLVCAKGSGS